MPAKILIQAEYENTCFSVGYIYIYEAKKRTWAVEKKTTLEDLVMLAVHTAVYKRIIQSA